MCVCVCLADRRWGNVCLADRRCPFLGNISLCVYVREVSVCNEPWLHHWVACYRCDTQSGGASSRVSAECHQLPSCHF